MSAIERDLKFTPYASVAGNWWSLCL